MTLLLHYGDKREGTFPELASESASLSSFFELDFSQRENSPAGH